MSFIVRHDLIRALGPGGRVKWQRDASKWSQALQLTEDLINRNGFLYMLKGKWLIALFLLLLPGTAYLLSLGGLVSWAVLAAIWTTLTVAYRPACGLPLLVILSIVSMRPNLLGENVNALGVGLLATIALMVSTSVRVKPTPRSSLRAIDSVFICVVLAHVWLLILASALANLAIEPILKGMFWSMLALGATSYICRSQSGARMLLISFVSITLLCCGSYLITLVTWTVSGPGSFQYTVLSGPGYGTPIPVYFPFTTTLSVQPFFGMQMPRFLGYGREPGWMALWAGAAMLLFKYTGLPWRWPRLVLAVGVIGTLSTAGFAILIVALAVEYTLGGHTKGLSRVARRTAGIVFVAVGTWGAIFAPVVGLSAKETQNAVSLDERSAATNAGWQALLDDPFAGGQGAEVVGSVNLVASIAVQGLPWAVAIVAAFTIPLLFHTAQRELVALCLLLGGTLLSAQPSQDSYWIYCLMMISCAVIPQNNSHVNEVGWQLHKHVQLQEYGHVVPGLSDRFVR